MKESHWRSIVKGVSWRVVASLTTTTLVYLYTGDILLTLQVSAIEVTIKIMFYYVHERVWGSVRWGRVGTEPWLK